jgi:CDGSH-type Zn-finger protein
MKTLRKVTIKPVCVEFIPDKKDMVQDEIYISAEYKTAVHLCLCGCGNLSVTPFMDDTDWRVMLRQSNGRDAGGLSIIPSILNTNCPNRYHYIITDNVANVV